MLVTIFVHHYVLIYISRLFLTKLNIDDPETNEQTHCLIMRRDLKKNQVCYFITFSLRNSSQNKRIITWGKKITRYKRRMLMYVSIIITNT
ncbi:protein of unknown function [Xenorhabdus poinarii G6]|uniref:Uncharacterized protein n=1 Tax=Xenorhabdus poinarii G6 TaxID=1354304 RepID=A0A068QZ16_9GAMM|nr:protein of unknown function [Xenorhabdus poinarii G6]